MIAKDQVLNEIKRRLNLLPPLTTGSYDEGVYHTLRNLQNFIKSLPDTKKPDFEGMIIHNYLKDCWQFCDGEISTHKCINPDYINVEVFITSKKSK